MTKVTISCYFFYLDTVTTEEDIMTEDKTVDFGRAATTQEAFRLIHAGPT